jgi:hypothetical protein
MIGLLKIRKSSLEAPHILWSIMIACLFLFFPLSSRAEKINKEETMIRPPMPESIGVVAYIGTKTEIDLRVAGRIQEPLKILIRKKPRSGTLSDPVRINQNTFRVVYSAPVGAFEGEDFFAYAAQSVDSPVSHSAQVQISIKQRPAQLEFPSSLDFGIVPVGDTREMQVDVRNSGGKTVHFSPTLSQPWGLVDPAPISISGGETKKIRIAFSPVSSGVFADKCTIDADSKGAISLRGASENPLQWPAEAILFTSKKRDNPEASVLFTNLTDAPRNLLFQWPDFLHAPSHITIDAGSSMEIPIHLKASPAFSWDGSVPLSSGKFEGSLAVVVEAAPPRIELDQSTPRDLGEVPFGTSANTTFVVRNSGGRAVRLSMDVPKGIKVTPSPSGLLLEPGKVLTLEAVVTPPQVGTFDFQLPVRYDSDSEWLGAFAVRVSARAAQPVESLLAIPATSNAPWEQVSPFADIPPIQECFLLESTEHSVTISWKLTSPDTKSFIIERREIKREEGGEVKTVWKRWEGADIKISGDSAIAHLRKLRPGTFWSIRIIGIDSKGQAGEPPTSFLRIETKPRGPLLPSWAWIALALTCGGALVWFLKNKVSFGRNDITR